MSAPCAGLGPQTTMTAGSSAAGALAAVSDTRLRKVRWTQLPHITRLSAYATGKYMMLDSSTRRNLELCETLREKQKRGSLLWVLDKTKTAMGARMLRKYVEQPLIEKKEILRRLDAVEELKEQAICREEIREYLSPVYDLERLVTKITYRFCEPEGSDCIWKLSDDASADHAVLWRICVPLFWRR